MKKSLIIFVSLISLQSWALNWQVIGPCSAEPLYQGSIEADLNKSLGEISLQVFDANKIPYVGVPQGFSSINKSPSGMDAIEVVSDSELRAYGWCYSINGQLPSQAPSELKPQSQQDTLIWYYGYVTHKDNQWGDYCAPGYRIKAAQFCRK